MKLRALTPREDGDDDDTEDAAREYLAVRTTSDRAFRDELYRIFGLYVPVDKRRQIGIMLDVLK